MAQHPCTILGVDDRTKLAVVAAAQLVSEREYNRSDLIPEVTKLVQVTLMWLSQERDEPDFCKRFGDPLIKLGTMQKAHQ